MCLSKKVCPDGTSRSLTKSLLPGLVFLPILLLVCPPLANKALALDSPSMAIAQTTASQLLEEAETLLDQGWQQMKSSQFQASIESYERALSISRAIAHRQIEAEASGGLGAVYSLLGNYQQSISYQQQSLAIYQEMGDRYSAADALQGIADSYWAIGNYQQARAHFQQTLSIYQQMGDYEGEQYILGLLDQLDAQ